MPQGARLLLLGHVKPWIKDDYCSYHIQSSRSAAIMTPGPTAGRHRTEQRRAFSVLRVKHVGRSTAGPDQAIHHSWRYPGRATLSAQRLGRADRKSTRLNSSHVKISYAVFCLKKKKQTIDV